MIDRIYIPTIGRSDRQITWNNLSQKWKDKTVLVIDSSEENMYNEPTITIPKEVKGIEKIQFEKSKITKSSSNYTSMAELSRYIGGTEF